MIIDELQQTLAKWYPGSVLDDSYYFVRLEGTGFTRTRTAGVSATQIYEELFRSEERLLVTCVELDLAAYVPPGTELEERSICYMPDYHVSRLVPQRFAAISGRDLDAAGFFDAVVSSYNAAYVFCPRTGFALTYDGCFTSSEEGQAELQRRYPERST